MPTNDNYRLSYRTASQSGRSPGFRVFVDGEYSDIFDIPSTGGWQNWQTQQGRVIALNSGTHVIRFDAASAGMNLNWFSLASTNSAVDELPENGDDIDVNGVPVDSASGFIRHVYPMVQAGLMEKFNTIQIALKTLMSAMEPLKLLLAKKLIPIRV